MMHSMRSLVAVALVSSFGASGASDAAEPAKYPAMAPIEAYRIKNVAEEIALARSAASPAISSEAEVLVLGSRGYETAVKGKNGYVCLVFRSWEAIFDDPEFWNPKVRSPNCFNPVAARTELLRTLKRTEWVLAGADKQQLIERTRTAISDHTFKAPEPGAFSFMLSKRPLAFAERCKGFPCQIHAEDDRRYHRGRNHVKFESDTAACHG
jgi:hypothetical protein